jgi:hypothetical protein
MSTGRKTNMLFRIFCFALLLIAGAVTQAQASHFRFGHITWEPRPEVSPTTVDVHISLGYRASYFGRPQVGQSFGYSGVRFGDGA